MRASLVDWAIGMKVCLNETQPSFQRQHDSIIWFLWIVCGLLLFSCESFYFIHHTDTTCIVSSSLVYDRCISTRHAVVHTHRINANTYDCSRINTKRMRETIHTNCNIMVVKRPRRHIIGNNQWTQMVVVVVAATVVVVAFLFCQFLKWAMGLKWITALLPFNCLFLWWFHMINC